MKILKVAKIVYTDRQMPTPQDLPQTYPPRENIRMQKPQSGGIFSVQIPGDAQRLQQNW